MSTGAAITRGTPADSAAAEGWPVRWFIILQIVCQLVLLTSFAAGPFRSVIRIAAFGTSLLFMLFLQGRGKGSPHPASKPAVIVFVLMALAIFHPDTNNFASGLAENALYLAILAPLFWVPRLPLSMRGFRAIVLTLWAFYALSAMFGILQVYYPGRFQPNLSSVLTAKGANYFIGVSIKLAGGQRVLRPMGLTDTPGGAGNAGFYTVLLGLGFLLTERALWKRAMFAGVMLMGMICIYLCQVRSQLVMLAICVIAILAMLAWRGAAAKLTMLITVLGIVVVAGFFWAVSVGGTSISKRVATLGTNNASQTYYKSRGVFFEYTVNDLLPKYPLGAGLGRWGMMNAYFGDKTKPTIWAEIQWTAWLLDGGVPLILAYLVTMAFAFHTALKITLGVKRNDLWVWGSIVLAYNLGACALIFSYPLFVSQTGMEFWMLNAALFAAARSSWTAPQPRIAAYRPALATGRPRQTRGYGLGQPTLR